ncbi:unnamed protein product, partial [marine sediment metagenome]
YTIDKKTGTIDYDNMEKIALKEKPKMIFLCLLINKKISIKLCKFYK